MRQHEQRQEKGRETMTIWHINSDDPAVRMIANNDPQMDKLIRLIGDIDVTMRTDYFRSICRSIVGQLISIKAANTIFSRLETMVNGEFTARRLSECTQEEIQAVGLSARKAMYIKYFAEKVVKGEIDLQQLNQLDNDQVIKQLTEIKGIGKWTAEMFLIFSLGRTDVMALDDIGLQRGAQWLYQTPSKDRREILAEKSKLWHDWSTFASFYLWEAVLQNFVTQQKTIDELI